MNPEPFSDGNFPDDLKPLEPLELAKMPATVIGALVIAGIFIGLEVVLNLRDKDKGLYAPSTIISAIVGGLIIVGFFQANRLAWQWGRLIGLLYGVFLAVIFVLALIDGKAGELPVLVATAFPAVLLIGMGLLLGTRSACAYFRLVCPECRSSEVRGVDFFFRRAKCRMCGRLW